MGAYQNKLFTFSKKEDIADNSPIQGYAKGNSLVNTHQVNTFHLRVGEVLLPEGKWIWFKFH